MSHKQYRSSLKFRRRRGFIIFFGWRVVTMREFKAAVRARCPHCQVNDARFVGRIRRRWFTLFFIPVVPLESASQALRFSECRECGAFRDVPLEDIARRTQAEISASFADTIRVYNELRERPSDGKTMLKLLSLYQQLGEVEEAETAARHFPSAMAADPACAELLETIRSQPRHADSQ